MDLGLYFLRLKIVHTVNIDSRAEDAILPDGEA